MQFSNLYRKIKLGVNIVDFVSKFVKLKNSGAEFKGLCPFHKEKTPSFFVNSQKGFFNCFGCNAHGNVIDFYSQMYSVKYHEAALRLAQEFRIDCSFDSHSEICKKAEESTFNPNIIVKFFQDQLNSNNIAKDYLEKRGVNSKLISNFELGYIGNYSSFEKFINKTQIQQNDLSKIGLISYKSDKASYIFFNRIIFPIRNINDKLVAFGGRIIDSNIKSPKYLNSPETNDFKKKEVLYAENIALKEATKTGFFILVEGYLDVVILHKMGYKSAGAILGTSFSEEHYEKIFNYTKELRVCFDTDSAGLRAIIRLIKLILPKISPDKKVSFIILPPGSDPGDLDKFPNKEVFDFAMKRRLSTSEMIWKIESQMQKIKSPEDRAFLQHRLQIYSNLISNNILKSNFAYFFKTELWKLKKIKNKFNEDVISKIASIKKYEELEFLEYIIISLVFFYPKILEQSENFYNFHGINFHDNLLNELKFVICDEFLQSPNNFLSKKVVILLNGSRLEKLIMILYQVKDGDCAVLFSQIDSGSPNFYFDFFTKKRYLLLLRNEYSQIVKNSKDHLDKKIVHYIREIQKMDFELNSFNEEII